MTIPRLREITKYQNSNPPLHLMVAAYFGVGKDGGSGESKTFKTGTDLGRDENGSSLFDMIPMG